MPPPSVDSTASTASDLYIVCRPDHFKVIYAINGHMHEGMEIWRKNSTKLRMGVRSLWRQGVAEIARHKGKIIRIQPDSRCPDQLFAADPLLAFIAEDGTKTALISRMKYKERQVEVALARRAIRQAGFTSIIESNCTREGSGDTLFDPNYGIWFVGVGQRTAPGAGKQLSEISGRPVIEIPTSSDEFYHIDTFMSFLPKGHVMLYKDALTPEAYKLICSLYPDDKRLEIDRRAAMKFAANPQILTEYTAEGGRHHTIVMPTDTPKKVTDQLRFWGYSLETIDIKAARRAGGGIHCCFQRVWDLRKYPLRALPENFMDYLATRQPVSSQRNRTVTWGIKQRSDKIQASLAPILVA